MEENSVWIVSLIALGAGALIGYLAGRSTGSNAAAPELAEQLEAAQEELADYKAKVTGHFEETADLVNQMTESYRGVYQKLAAGAQELCGSETARTLEAVMTPQLTEQKEVQGEEVDPSDIAHSQEPVVTPPKDYAPKQPDQEGTLSESYGVKTEDATVTAKEEATATTAPPEEQKPA